MITQLTVIGEVVISTKRKKDLKDFVYLQLLSEKDSIHPTTLHEVFTYGKTHKEKVFKILNTLITKDKGKYQVKLHVDGIGNKTFEDNIELFFEKPLSKKYEDESINDIRDKLKTVKFEATFDIHDYYYSDSEPINNSIYKVKSFNGNNTLTIIKE